MNDILSLTFGSFLSIAFRLFICLTKSDTLAVDALRARMDSSKYLPISPDLRLISGGMLTYILLRIYEGFGYIKFLSSKPLTLSTCLSIR